MIRDARTVDASQLQIAACVRPGDVVAWGQCGAEPLTLTQALIAARQQVGERFGVFIGVQWSDTVRPEHADSIDIVSYTGGGTNRALSEAGVLQILPTHYSQFARSVHVDVLLVQVAPADRDGHYSLSIAHEYLLPYLDSARVVIAEVNACAPWTYGSRTLTARDFDLLVHTERAPMTLDRAQASATDAKIATHAATLVEDGATLQFGMGALPEAILAALSERRDLGMHSGTFGDAAADLMERGVITNARKSIDTGVSVAGVMMGGERAYRYAHRNPRVQFRGTSYTHDIDVLGRIDRFVAINSALEVDLTGQVNAESANGRYLGGVGGGVDFLRGAARSRGGVPIVALPATTRNGSRIVSRLNGPVSTPRSDAGVIVTEYGIADLRGLSLSQRVRKMIDVAAPHLRATLDEEAHLRTHRRGGTSAYASS
ncbi:acetyl-CoA hydrolase/transferase C-terminal domain-containing protein [Paraburkholderia sp.]|uniref:acetyl-CoA hydrolase/transferase family protein n=1 Tax=Paraburkholderia sp. TaxID=1926495 RepID=UPI0023A59657|nr:acetyl-CoA hydrolase/transferase C-terminal domain-containing protein [Paraburkholderia sp.]MDE1184777.1 acetyl-CoA hydrolase/transferase C-terminal domain-containing protein [Paraburkholderia sp.]